MKPIAPVWPKLLALVLGCVVAMASLEVALRWRPPFDTTVRGSGLQMPVHRRFERYNPRRSSKLDRLVVNEFNSLGFRGPEPPPDFDRHLTILTVGGSTTACSLITEGKTWPDLLANQLEETFSDTWLNNAGFSGHSTFAHAVLLERIVAPLRPDYVLYLVGINDAQRANPHRADSVFDPRSAPPSALLSALRRSEVFHVAETLGRMLRAHGQSMREDLELNFAELPRTVRSEADIEDELAAQGLELVPAYVERLTNLVRTTRGAGIEPVLMTQTYLAGDFVDPSTGVRFRDLMPSAEVSSVAAWRLINLYNDATREVARLEKVFLIDLAEGFPRDSKYYYDFLHYSNEGARLVSERVFAKLAPFLRARESSMIVAARETQTP